MNRLILVLTFASFVLGVTLPMFSLEKFMVLEDSFSVLGGLWHYAAVQAPGHL